MKLRTIFTIVAALCFGMQLSTAQSRDVAALEFEIGGGIVSPTEQLDFDKNHLGFNAQAELRYNFQELPLDIGLHVDGALFKRDGKQFDTKQDLWKLASAQFTSFTGMAVIDVNAWRAKGFSLFLGCGAGYGMLISDVKNISNIKDIDRMGCFCIMPRVGVELLRHFRATLYYKHLKKEQNHFGLSVGFVFGGGRR
jgi:opacity protein-like surface antigen